MKSCPSPHPPSPLVWRLERHRERKRTAIRVEIVREQTNDILGPRQFPIKRLEVICNFCNLFYFCFSSFFSTQSHSSIILVVVIVPVQPLNVIRGEITNGNGGTSARLVVLAALPVLLRAPQTVPIEAHIVDDQDLRGLVLGVGKLRPRHCNWPQIDKGVQIDAGLQKKTKIE